MGTRSGRVLAIGTMLVGLGVLALLASAAPAKERASVVRAARLSPLQLEKLRQLKIPIVLPTFLPAGFQLKSIKMELRPEYGASYQVVYHGRDARQVIRVQGVSGSPFEGPGGDRRLPFTNPELGKGELVWTARTSSTPENGWSGWLRGPSPSPAYSLSADGVPVRQVVRMAESLRFLDPPPPSSSTTAPVAPGRTPP